MASLKIENPRLCGEGFVDCRNDKNYVIHNEDFSGDEKPASSVWNTVYSKTNAQQWYSF